MSGIKHLGRNIIKSYWKVIKLPLQRSIFLLLNQVTKDLELPALLRGVATIPPPTPPPPFHVGAFYTDQASRPKSAALSGLCGRSCYTTWIPLLPSFAFVFPTANICFLFIRIFLLDLVSHASLSPPSPNIYSLSLCFISFFYTTFPFYLYSLPSVFPPYKDLLPFARKETLYFQHNVHQHSHKLLPSILYSCNPSAASSYVSICPYLFYSPYFNLPDFLKEQHFAFIFCHGPTLLYSPSHHRLFILPLAQLYFLGLFLTLAF